jgi:hypothetical protein
VAPGNKVLFKLHRPDGAKFVRLDLKSIKWMDYAPTRIDVRAAVIGGTQRSSTAVEVSAGADPLADGGAASDPAHLELPLADAGDTVLVDVSGMCVSGSVPRSTGAWIDSLRVE